MTRIYIPEDPDMDSWLPQRDPVKSMGVVVEPYPADRDTGLPLMSGSRARRRMGVLDWALVVAGVIVVASGLVAAIR